MSLIRYDSMTMLKNTPIPTNDKSDRRSIIHYAAWTCIGLMAASLPASKFTFSMFQFFLGGLFILNGINHDDFIRFYRESSTAKKILFTIPFLVFISMKALWFSVKTLPGKKVFFVFCLFYLAHGLAVLNSENLDRAFAELRTKLPMLIIPMFFLSIKGGTENWKHTVLLLFVASTLVASFTGTINFIIDPFADSALFSPFIHHINFSVFAAFSVFILLIHPFYGYGYSLLPAWIKWLVVVFLIGYLMFILKSLTGVVVLFSGFLVILLFPQFFQTGIRPLASRITGFTAALGVVIFIGYSIHNFYDVTPINLHTLEERTSKDNLYFHDTSLKIIENGHYVFLYIADEELKNAWNARSSMDYEGYDRKGHDLRYTLYRYMSSKGLRKDAEGLEKLDSSDIQNIEQGLTNYIYASRYSLYPRIYQTIWEYDLFLKTGSFSEKSSIQRLASLGIGIEVARDNLLIGVGTGDVADAYYAEYQIQYDLDGLDIAKDKLITGANQWLNFIVAFGIPGFLVILFAFFYPAFVTGAFRNPLFVIFLLVASVAMFGEDTLRFQTGLGFFAFFYSFFVFLKPLEISKKNVVNE